MKPISIIIPNFNGEPILAKTLSAVQIASEDYGGESEVIVVDDASSDASVSLVETVFPNVRIVRHASNRGFSEAVSSGVSAARHEILVLLNSDVRPESGFLAPLVSALANPSVFAVSPLVCAPDGSPQDVSWNLYRIRRGNLKSRKWNVEEALKLSERGPLKSLFASGGSVALKKERFLLLGGFHPLYKPFYSEDVDLCTRAWMRGWQTVFEPRSRVVHDHVGTIKRFFAASKIRTIRVRNRYFYLWLYLSDRTLLRSHAPWTLFRTLTYLARFDLADAMGLFKALAHRKKVVRLKSEIQKYEQFRSLEMLLEEIDPGRAG